MWGGGLAYRVSGEEARLAHATGHGNTELDVRLTIGLGWNLREGRVLLPVADDQQLEQLVAASIHAKRKREC
jgi:hypothetical protein